MVAPTVNKAAKIAKQLKEIISCGADVSKKFEQSMAVLAQEM